MPLWREGHFQVKMLKTWGLGWVRTTFGGTDVEKGQRGAKHVFKSKCTKHQRFGALLEVRMSKKCPTNEIDRSIVDSQLDSSSGSHLIS